jgi:hypothetical protein
VRNIPGKKTLSEVKYRALVRDVVPAGSGASVGTWNDRVLLEDEDFFLFPGCDQVLLSFKLERNDDGLMLVRTNKMGEELTRVPLSQCAVLVADYSANLENLFNFDIKVAKRVELAASRLTEVYDTIRRNNVEQNFAPTRVRDVG